MRTQADSLVRSIKPESSVRSTAAAAFALHNRNKRLKRWEKRMEWCWLCIHCAAGSIWISDRVRQHPVTECTQEAEATRRSCRQLQNSSCRRHRLIEFPFTIANAKEIIYATRMVNKCRSMREYRVSNDFALRYQISTPHWADALAVLLALSICDILFNGHRFSRSRSLSLLQLCLCGVCRHLLHILFVHFSPASLPCCYLFVCGLATITFARVCSPSAYLYACGERRRSSLYVCKFSSDKTLRLASPDKSVCRERRGSTSASSTEFVHTLFSTVFLWHPSLIEFVMIYCEPSVRRIVGRAGLWGRTNKKKYDRARQHAGTERGTAKNKGCRLVADSRRVRNNER